MMKVSSGNLLMLTVFDFAERNKSFFSVGGGGMLTGRGCAPQVLGTFNTFHLMASLEAGLDVSGKFIVLAKKRML